MSEELKEVVTEEVTEEVVEETKEVNDVMANTLIDHDKPIMTVRKLLDAGAHFGHQTKKWNPKMKPYIYTKRNGIYIIDLTKTVEKVNEAYVALKKIVEEGGKVIFVGTKKNCQEVVQEEAARSGSFYATSRWLGGTLTNFKTIQKRIKFLRDIEDMEKDGTFALLPKKEVAQYYKEKEKLEKNLGGIKEMRRTPQALFVIDPLIEINAVREARKLGIPVFGVVDTNSDPDLVDYVIPANDDSNKAVKLLLQVMADAVVEAKGGDMSQILVAYTDDEVAEEATMDDVIANADAVEKARQERKAAEAAARKAQLERQQKNFKKGGRQFSKSTADLKDKKEKVEEKAEEANVEGEEKPAEEAKEVVKKPRTRKPRKVETAEAKTEEVVAEEKPAEETKAE